MHYWILLSVSASSGVAEETNAGVAFSVALSAALSAGEGDLQCVSVTFLLCLLHQVIFTVRETHLHFLFPGGPVCGGCFPGVSVEAQRFEVTIADVLAPQLRASGRSLPCHQLTVQKVLGDASVFHAADVAQPSHVSLFEEGEHGWDVCSFEHCTVFHLVS